MQTSPERSSSAAPSTRDAVESRSKVRFGILKALFQEWVSFDSRLVHFCVWVPAGLLGCALYRAGSRRLSFKLMSKLHRTGRPARLCELVQTSVARGFAGARMGRGCAFDEYLGAHIRTSPSRAQECFVRDPLRMIKHMAIVVSSAESRTGKGVVVLKYNHTFPLFAREFDLRRVAERYRIVIEPSWAGYCTEDVLAYTLLSPHLVYVQTIEDYDRQFLEAINTNLVPIPVAANWWVDHRLLSPDPSVEKDLDFIVVSSWADFKRHHRIFHALQSLRRNGHRLRGACVGYPSGLTMEDIEGRAEYYGVRDQLEFHDYVPQTEVARIMNRAKVNLVWSRREGFNRVAIEGLFCDVPCLLRQGHNYGQKYSYINEQTGRYCSEGDLPRALMEMTQGVGLYSPAEWALRHMTPQRATAIISEFLFDRSDRAGGELPELAVKVNGLNGMDYWDPGAEGEFEADYEFLTSLRYRRRGSQSPPSRSGEGTPPQTAHV